MITVERAVVAPATGPDDRATVTGDWQPTGSGASPRETSLRSKSRRRVRAFAPGMMMFGLLVDPPCGHARAVRDGHGSRTRSLAAGPGGKYIPAKPPRHGSPGPGDDPGSGGSGYGP
jgi:hypothetical protein